VAIPIRMPGTKNMRNDDARNAGEHDRLSDQPDGAGQGQHISSKSDHMVRSAHRAEEYRTPPEEAGPVKQRAYNRSSSKDGAGHEHGL
jgi:hypothetical protein